MEQPLVKNQPLESPAAAPVADQKSLLGSQVRIDLGHSINDSQEQRPQVDSRAKSNQDAVLFEVIPKKVEHSMKNEEHLEMAIIAPPRTANPEKGRTKKVTGEVEIRPVNNFFNEEL